jgi:hypothetical protein
MTNRDEDRQNARIVKESHVDLRMTVQHQNVEKNLLKITLRNEGEEVECSISRLPWSHWHSMTIVCVTMHGHVLPMPLYIDDPWLGSIKIQPHETVEGEIDLERRFPKIAEFLLVDGIDVFWSFQFVDVDGRKATRNGGWLFIPKS